MNSANRLKVLPGSSTDVLLSAPAAPEESKAETKSDRKSGSKKG